MILAKDFGMEELHRRDRKKILTGVAFICAAVIAMFAAEENSSFFAKALWLALLGVGLAFYLWGRFFPGGKE